MERFQKPDSNQPQFSPPVFEYGKAAQPDLQKWRYYQQQEADSKSMAKIKERLDSNGLFRKAFHFRTQNLPTVLAATTETKLQPRWKMIHPKFVNEKTRDVSPKEAMSMDFGRRENKKIVIIVPPKTIVKDERRTNRKQDYNVKEHEDLEVQASENYERIEPQNQAAFLPPPGLYKNQNDITALNSLLGQSPSVQLEGLQQLLHSQGSHVAQMPSQTDVSSLFQTNGHAGVQSLLEGGKILAKPQDLSKLQAQLDALTQNQAQKALLEAQAQAEQHVKQQHEAIERQRIEGQKKALAQIQNLAIAHQGKQIESANLVEESSQQHLAISEHRGADGHQIGHQIDHQVGHQVPVEHQAPIAQALTGAVDHSEAIDHAVLQAQAYLQLSAPNHQVYASTTDQHQGFTGVEGGQHLGGQSLDQNSNRFSSYGQVTGQEEGQHLVGHLGEQHHGQSLGQNTNQFSSYGSYPVGSSVLSHQDGEEHVQDPQVLAKTPIVQEHSAEGAENAHQHEQHEEYAPQYKFGYRIMDYHSGNDFGHEESREGKMTKGQYHTLLPDGRMQNVVYWADPSGYHAKVTYSNVAQH